MIYRYLSLALFLVSNCVCAVQVNGRASVSGIAAKADQGEIGYENDIDILNADQQSFRLMLEDSAGDSLWSFHLDTKRLHLKGLPFSTKHSSDLFRYYDLSHHWRGERDRSSRTRIGYEVDQAYFRIDKGNLNLGIGRQPVDWGSGRFWQPMNVFGAFAPTDLDTEYKPGIDTVIVDWFPSAFSSLEAVYAFAPNDRDKIKNSGALYYRRQAGQNSELALLAGRVLENSVYGTSFESDLRGAGWRIEGVYYDLSDSKDNEWFWIAGVDYQFNNGTLITAEWYNNTLGVRHESSLLTSPIELFELHGLKQHFSQQILGISLNRDMTPLLNANYSLLISPLKNSSGHHEFSALHQFNLVYSVSDESEFVFSLQHTSGTGLDRQKKLTSEFGHLPDSLTLIYRYYF